MIFNNEIIEPQVTTTKQWLLRHAEHRKVQEVLKDQNGAGPDMRVIFCASCQELLVTGVINE